MRHFRNDKKEFDKYINIYFKEGRCCRNASSIHKSQITKDASRSWIQNNSFLSDLCCPKLETIIVMGSRIHYIITKKRIFWIIWYKLYRLLNPLYSTLADLINKNIEKIKKPRSSNHAPMYWWTEDKSCDNRPLDSLSSKFKLSSNFFPRVPSLETARGILNRTNATIWQNLIVNWFCYTGLFYKIETSRRIMLVTWPAENGTGVLIFFQKNLRFIWPCLAVEGTYLWGDEKLKT